MEFAKLFSGLIEQIKDLFSFGNEGGNADANASATSTSTNTATQPPADAAQLRFAPGELDGLSQVSAGSGTSTNALPTQGERRIIRLLDHGEQEHAVETINASPVVDLVLMTPPGRERIHEAVTHYASETEAELKRREEALQAEETAARDRAGDMEHRTRNNHGMTEEEYHKLRKERDRLQEEDALQLDEQRQQIDKLNGQLKQAELASSRLDDTSPEKFAERMQAFPETLKRVEALAEKPMSRELLDEIERMSLPELTKLPEPLRDKLANAFDRTVDEWSKNPPSGLMADERAEVTSDYREQTQRLRELTEGHEQVNAPLTPVAPGKALGKGHSAPH